MKFAASQKRADADGTELKLIERAEIDEEASGVDLGDATKITVLEQRGRNNDGVPVGTVRVVSPDGAETVEVKFAEPKPEKKKPIPVSEREKPKVELKDIRIDEDVENESGDTVQVSRTADVVIKEIDDRIDNVKLLSGCMRG